MKPTYAPIKYLGCTEDVADLPRMHEVIDVLAKRGLYGPNYRKLTDSEAGEKAISLPASE